MAKISLSIRSEVLCIFVAGCYCGFLTSLLLPEVGRSYFNLYASDVTSFALRLQSRLGVAGLVAAVFLRNVTPISALTFFPYVLVAYYSGPEWRNRGRGFKSLKLSLKMLSFCPILAYGFAVYGLFLGYLYAEFSAYHALRILFSLMSHGWLEILLMLSAASTGLNLAGIIEPRDDGAHPRIGFRSAFDGWRWLASGTLIAALIEVLFYPLLV